MIASIRQLSQSDMCRLTNNWEGGGLVTDCWSGDVSIVISMY